jgi:hypothetical protein
MLFFVGAFFILFGIIKAVMILAASGRPKQEVQIKDFTFMKLKTDLIGFGGDQKHAKVAFDVNGITHETDVFVGKKFNTPVGGKMMISYNAGNPKNAKYHNLKMEWMMVIVLLVMGGVISGISLALTSVLFN